MKVSTIIFQPKKKNRSDFFRNACRLCLLLLFFAGLFITKASAQQPACNISGPLKTKIGSNGKVTISSQVMNTSPQSKYVWTFKQNSSKAVILSGNGTPSINIDAGKLRGNFTVALKVINPPQRGLPTLSCNCSKSVSVTE